MDIAAELLSDLADGVIEAMRQVKRHDANDKPKLAVRTMVFALASLAQMAMKFGDQKRAGGVISAAQKLDAIADKLQAASAKLG